MLLWERTSCQPLQLSTRAAALSCTTVRKQPRSDSRAEPMSRKPFSCALIKKLTLANSRRFSNYGRVFILLVNAFYDL